MKSQDQEPPPLCVTIPFHDKRARVADVVGFFLPHALHSDIPLSRIFHMDRSATVRILSKPHFVQAARSHQGRPLQTKTLSNLF